VKSRKEDDVAQVQLDEDEELWQDLENVEPGEGRMVDAFMKIDGIDGESQDSKHKGEIEILGWVGHVENIGSAHSGGGGGTGRSVHHGFKFAKLVEKSSPKLMQACASGEHLKKAEFVVRKAGKEQQEYLKITFSDVLISGFRHLEHLEPTSNLPRDGFELSYGKAEMEYKEQKADGTLGGAIKAGWNVKERKSV
jgi:type VI secretion system secreted protein Hcp